MESAFAKPTNEVLAAFEVDPKAGLTDEQITELRNKHGKNCMLQRAILENNQVDVYANLL